MPNRDFDEWLGQFRDSICNYEYYVNFAKVYENVNEIKVELNIMNSLIGSRDIERDFEKLVAEYPKVLKCIPTLLAVQPGLINRKSLVFFNTANQTWANGEASA